MIRDSKKRLEALRKLLEEGELSSQEALRDKLEKQDFDVTQSTVSRDLRKIGAVRVTDHEGQTVYRLSESLEPSNLAGGGGLADLVREITTNNALIVIHTAAGSASLIARHLDNVTPGGILGTIAGDDTIFVAPGATTPKEVKQTIQEIYRCLTPS